MKLLLTGDLHLGRASTRTGDADVRAHRTVGAWERMVDLAIREGVRVVCLSGDIVDSDNAYWESIGPLSDGIQRMGEAGILTVAVSGNHDFDVFTRLAKSIQDERVFRLLGMGGHWERLPVDDMLEIQGWSFPSREVRTNPTASYDLSRPAGVPVLGMVHGDVGVSDSKFAPLSLSGLRTLPVDGWLLGHIHVPSLQTGTPWVLYPGSPQALDPGETGVHGPWFVEIERGRLGQPRQIGLSSVRYEQPEIDVSGWTDLDVDVFSSFRSTATELLERDDTLPDILSLRPVFTGHTKLHAALADHLHALTDGDTRFAVQGVQVIIDRWMNRSLPEIDLQVWLETDTVPGALARLIEYELPDDLVRAVASRMADYYRGVPGTEERTDAEVEQLVRDAATVLLSEVMK